jgi:hypothetical protein
MKSLKPRAWLKTKKRMVGTDDLLVIDYDLTQIMTQQVFFERGLAVERDIKYYDFEDIELMQSTGLFDKKGVEIFEGDVISTYTDNLVIKRDNLLGFYVEYAEVDEKRNYFAETVDIEYLDLFAKDFGVAVEVLGNIYENADLLGKEESDKETVAELVVKGVFDKKSERWYVDTDEATVEAMNSFLEEHDLDVFESWLGYLEGGMSDESLAFINILQTIKDEIELADGSKIKLVEG